MDGLSSTPPLVNRVSEMARLQRAFNEVKAGQGQLLFLAGEAGQGKTRLAAEAERTAREEGFAVGHGVALEESPVLYMVWEDALRGLDLGHVLVEGAPPRLLALYVLTKAGLVAARAERESGKTDTEILGGMIAAVSSFVGDAFTNMGVGTVEGPLARMSQGSNTIVVHKGDGFGLCAIVKGRESESFLGEMAELSSSLEERFGGAIRGWDGNMAATSEWDSLLMDAIHSGRWEGEGKLDAEGRRWYLFDNVARGLSRKARIRPVLLVLDDLQWADPSSLSLLHYVSRNTRSDCVLILGTYRTEETGLRPHLDRAIGAMRREDLGESLHVGPLPRSDARALVSLLVGRNELPAGFFEVLEKETEGSPLYIREMLRVLKDEGTIFSGQDGVIRLRGNPTEVHVPERVKDVVARRIAFLDKDERRILNAAAVAGTRFSGELVAGALDNKELEVLEKLQELSDRHHLLVSERNGFRFDHPLTREVTLSLLAPELKRVIHKSCAKWLKARGGGPDVVGEHLWGAGSGEAVPLLAEAVKVAESRYAFDEACRLLRMALDLLPTETPERGELGTHLAECLLLGSHFEDAAAVAAAQVKASGGLERCSQVLVEALEALGRWDEAGKCCDEGLGLGSLSLAGHAELLAWKARLEYAKSRRPQGATFARQALELLAAPGEGDQLAVRAARTHALGALARCVGTRKETSERGRVIDQWMVAAEASGDLRSMAQALHEKAKWKSFEGDNRGSIELCDRCIRLCEAIGYKDGAGSALNTKGVQLDAVGETLEEQYACYERAFKLKGSIGNLQGTAIALENMGAIAGEMMNFPASLESSNRALALYRKIGDDWGVADCLTNIGDSQAAMGEREAAVASFDRARAILDKSGIIGCLFETLSLEVETLLALGRPADALRLAQEGLEIAVARGSRWDQAKALASVACARMGCGELVRGRADMEQARGIVDWMEDPMVLARCNLAWGRLEAERGDSTEARSRFESAYNTFHVRGKRHLMHEAAQAMRALDQGKAQTKA